MSYCAWSTDDWFCDLYCMDIGHGMYQTRVGWRRPVYKTQLPPKIEFSQRDTIAYWERFKAVQALHRVADFVEIDLPYAGHTFVDEGLEAFRSRLLELRGLGYNFPDYVFEVIEEEIRERDTQVHPLTQDEVGAANSNGIEEKYKIYHKGKLHHYINWNLAAIRWLSDEDLAIIRDLHEQQLAIYDQMVATDDRSELRRLAADIEELEFALQRAWGFPEDRSHHRWYEVPKCSCSKIDSRDNEGTCVRNVAPDCPVHGGEGSC